jgi:hypothetical protein
VSFAAITLCVASQRVIVVVVVVVVVVIVIVIYFVTDSVRERLDTPSYEGGWTIGVLDFESRRSLGIFLFTTAFRTALGPTRPPIQWVPGALCLGVKRPGREADQSPTSSAEVKE